MNVLGVEVPPAVAEREPVLQVPAIDMTDRSQPEDTVSSQVASADVAKPTRQRRAKSKAGAPKKAAAKPAMPKRSRDGSVGGETFAAVEALVKDGSSKTDAFKAVAEKTNRSAGTVAATYYRVARSEGAVKPRRGRSRATTPPAPKRRSAGRSDARASTGNIQEIDRLATSLVESVNALASVVKSQSLEVADLRQRLDGVRSLLG